MTRLKTAQIVEMFNRAASMFATAATTRDYNRAVKLAAKLPRPEQYVLVKPMFAALGRINPRRLPATRETVLRAFAEGGAV